MKKLILCLAVVLSLFACRGRDGRDGRDGMVNKAIIDLEASGNGWEYSNMSTDNYYKASFDMPEITDYIYDNGVILVYREWDTGKATATQQVLPYSRHHEWLDAETNTWNFFTETVDFECGPGFLNIFYTASDFDYELQNPVPVPEDMHFRVVVMW